MAVVLTGEARARLDAHLDAVERELARAGSSREQRRGVVDDLEAQVLDMLAERGGEPTVGEVEAVLGKLDSPEAYAEGSGREGAAEGATVARVSVGDVSTRPRYSRLAVVGLVCNGVAAFLFVALLVIAAYVIPQVDGVNRDFGRPTIIERGPMEVHVGAEGRGVYLTERAHVSPRYRLLLALIFGGVVGPAALAGTVLGWVAFARIRRSAGMLKGTGLALVDGLLWPLVAGLVVMAGMFFA